MATLFCKWPASAEAEAMAYIAGCDPVYRALTGEPDVVWGEVRADRDGAWIAPLMATPWFFAAPGDFDEPADCLALRAGAEIIETPDWPDPEA